MEHRQSYRHTMTLACLGAILCTLILAGTCLGAKDLFSHEIDRSVNDAITAGHRDDQQGLSQALRRLTLNEARLLAAGLSDEKRSYLRLVPLSCNKKPASIAACLYFLREQRRRGVDLLHQGHFFAGERFTLTIKDRQSDSAGEVR